MEEKKIHHELVKHENSDEYSIYRDRPDIGWGRLLRISNRKNMHQKSFLIIQFSKTDLFAIIRSHINFFLQFAYKILWMFLFSNARLE